MSCASCHQDIRQPVAAPLDISHMADISVVDNGTVRALQVEDWPPDEHKLLIFYPETFTPVCQTELAAINQWIPAFAELNCRIIAACTDPAMAIADWYQNENLLVDLDCITISSYLLPAQLGLVANGRAKRASVFITDDGTVIKQEHFHTVGRSFAELHRQLWAYTTDEYCAAGWTNPADGFL